MAPSVARALGADHEWFDTLVADALEAARSHDDGALTIRLTALVRALRSHLRAENEILFPAYERSSGSAAATALLREEHAAIEAMLDRLLELATRFDPALTDALAQLAATLEAHERREEAIFPACDRVVPASARVDTVRELDRKVSGVPD